MIEELEIAENFEINTKSNEIHVKITGILYQTSANKLKKLIHICGFLGCPSAVPSPSP